MRKFLNLRAIISISKPHRHPLCAALYDLCYLESQFYVFQTAWVHGCLYSGVSIEYITVPVSQTESVSMSDPFSPLFPKN